MRRFSMATMWLILSLPVMAQECASDIPRTAPNLRYVYSTQGTVKDLYTGLTWMRCTFGKEWNAAQGRCSGQVQPLRWQAALQEVQAINHPNSRHRLHQFAGVKQWRMPNIKELNSLTEHACFAPAANEMAFASGLVTEVGNLSGYLWSNTMRIEREQAWVWDAINGELYAYSIHGYEMGMLLVSDDE
ncbi:DUF1566 domain-containing protein [Vibrio metoecus]|uniref:Lcl C-terminal domain-containing protein n=1 Tax=Vibrio metoecus TaxID=1481663 RepID=UPI0006D8010F|nr:HutR like protein [Vibrio metoecus]